jgi:hypothetical protein
MLHAGILIMLMYPLHTYAHLYKYYSNTMTYALKFAGSPFPVFSISSFDAFKELRALPFDPCEPCELFLDDDVPPEFGPELSDRLKNFLLGVSGESLSLDSKLDIIGFARLVGLFSFSGVCGNVAHS